jgi:two-component system, sensor histidine kinase LadS
VKGCILQTYPMVRIKWFLFGILFVALWGLDSFCYAEGSAIELRINSKHLAITSGLAYLIETEPLDHLQVSSAALNSDWREFSGSSLTFGSFHPPTWFRFDIVNRSYKDWAWLLEIGWPLLDHVEVRQYNHATGLWSHKQIAGNGVPLDKHTIAHRHYLYPLILPPGEPVTVYIRVDSKHAMFVTLDLWQSDAFWRHDQHRILLLGLFFGVLGVMALYNTLLYFFTKDNNYLYYSAYGVAVIFYELAATGIGARYIWDASPYIREMGYTLFATLSFLTGAVFVRYFLSLKHHRGWVYQLNNSLVLFWTAALILLVFDLIPVVNAKAIETVALMTPIAGMATGVFLWWKGNKQAKYFTIAFSFLSIGTFMLMLGFTGYIERGPLTEYGQMIGFVLQLVLLSMALGARINRERAEREEARMIALDLSRKISKAHEEKLMIQEQMLELHRRANEDLEFRVLERTSELERAMNNLELANKELSKLSFTDPLTKVHNRRYFDQILSSEIKRASRTAQPLSVAIVDLDHFKFVNDTHGHLIGDECLRLVAKALSRNLGRTSDLIARFGGEEFAMILPFTSQENALIVADRARTAVAEINFIHRGRQVNLSVSIGVAGWVPSQNEMPEKLLQQADRALYQAKLEGRNRALAAGG